MSTTQTRQGKHPRMAARSAGTRLRRFAAILAAIISGLLASAATVPAAFAMQAPPPGGQGGSARRRAGTSDHRPCSRHGRHGGLADHLDRAGGRFARCRSGSTSLPGPGRPQGGLGSHRLTRAQRLAWMRMGAPPGNGRRSPPRRLTLRPASRPVFPGSGC